MSTLYVLWRNRRHRMFYRHPAVRFWHLSFPQRMIDSVVESPSVPVMYAPEFELAERPDTDA